MGPFRRSSTSRPTNEPVVSGWLTLGRRQWRVLVVAQGRSRRRSCPRRGWEPLGSGGLTLRTPPPPRVGRVNPPNAHARGLTLRSWVMAESRWLTPRAWATAESGGLTLVGGGGPYSRGLILQECTRPTSSRPFHRSWSAVLRALVTMCLLFFMLNETVFPDQKGVLKKKKQTRVLFQKL